MLPMMKLERLLTYHRFQFIYRIRQWHQFKLSHSIFLFMCIGGSKVTKTFWDFQTKWQKCFAERSRTSVIRLQRSRNLVKVARCRAKSSGVPGKSIFSAVLKLKLRQCLLKQRQCLLKQQHWLINPWHCFDFFRPFVYLWTSFELTPENAQIIFGILLTYS